MVVSSRGRQGTAPLTPVRIKPDSFHVDSLATALFIDDDNVLLFESVVEDTKAFAAR